MCIRSLTMKKLILLLLCFTVSALTARAAFEDIVNYFDNLNDADTTFPVPAKVFNDVESAFGPRLQVSVGGVYDWHRGIDIDGGSVGDPVGVYDVVAAADGEFYDFRTTSRGGYIVILRHSFSQPQTYNGQNLNYYYTWYLHLADDGVGGTFTDDSSDIINNNNWVAVTDNNGPATVIPMGTKLGLLGDTGTPSGGGTYAPHLHFELRVGSNASLDFQLKNLQTTQWGFDPHVNPMLLFEPYTYGPGANAYELEVAVDGTVEALEDVTVAVDVTNDDMPVFDKVEVVIRDKETQTEQTSHTLGLNEREGFDASTNENLDIRDTSVPYVDPESFLSSATEWGTTIVLPKEWLFAYDQRHEAVITVTDIWGNQEQEIVGLLPEPRSWAALAGAFVLIFAPFLRYKR